MHHFAHYAGYSCEYGYESSLHLAVKEILSKARRIMLPAVYISFPDSSKQDELLYGAKEIKIERVELERRFRGIIPDVVIYASGKRLFVAVHATHPIDKAKLAKLKEANISMIEIDLSKRQSAVTYGELCDILLKNRDEKKWRYNSVAEKYLKRFYRVADKRKIISRKFDLFIDDCPIKTQTGSGKAYANLNSDCSDCKYCISYRAKGNILCSGRLKIATVQDFSISADNRIEAGEKDMSELKFDSFLRRICPNCGGRLVERNGQYGAFWECSNYSRCRFTASVDPDTGELTMKA